jgi:Flp pilus assembly protein TadD
MTLLEESTQLEPEDGNDDPRANGSRSRSRRLVLIASIVAVVGIGGAAWLLAGEPGEESTSPIDQSIIAGLELHNAGELDEAEAIYRSVLADEPGHPTASYNLALIEQAHGEHDQAIKLFLTTLGARPSDMDAMFNLGISQAAIGRYEQALVSLGQVLQQDPTNARAMFQTGVVLVANGEPEAGEAMMNQAVELMPELRDLITGG